MKNTVYLLIVFAFFTGIVNAQESQGKTKVKRLKSLKIAYYNQDSLIESYPFYQDNDAYIKRKQMALQEKVD